MNIEEHLRPMPAATRDHFWAGVRRDGADECWVWTRAIRWDGYGRFKYRGRHVSAHRTAYFLANDALPEGQIVCHRCDNPPCCNPAHLFLGTHADNSRDKLEKGRGTYGATHPSAKLREDDVRAIRERCAARVPISSLATEYGVSKTTISGIKVGRIWKRVGGPLTPSRQRGAS